jgi:hypothetical protein
MASTAPNIAVLAPTPSATVMTAVSAKAGRRLRPRSVALRSSASPGRNARARGDGAVVIDRRVRGSTCDSAGSEIVSSAAIGLDRHASLASGGHTKEMGRRLKIETPRTLNAQKNRSLRPSRTQRFNLRHSRDKETGRRRLESSPELLRG